MARKTIYACVGDLHHPDTFDWTHGGRLPKDAGYHRVVPMPMASASRVKAPGKAHVDSFETARKKTTGAGDLLRAFGQMALDSYTAIRDDVAVCERLVVDVERVGPFFDADGFGWFQSLMSRLPLDERPAWWLQARTYQDFDAIVDVAIRLRAADGLPRMWFQPLYLGALRSPEAQAAYTANLPQIDAATTVAKITGRPLACGVCPYLVGGKTHGRPIPPEQNAAVLRWIIDNDHIDAAFIWSDRPADIDDAEAVLGALGA